MTRTSLIRPKRPISCSSTLRKDSNLSTNTGLLGGDCCELPFGQLLALQECSLDGIVAIELPDEEGLAAEGEW